MQIEELQSLLSNKELTVQKQGLVLFDSFSFEQQIEVGFLPLLVSPFEEMRKSGLKLLSSLSSERQTLCWNGIFDSITIAEDGTPESPRGWVWNSSLLDYFLSKVGTNLKGLRLSTICRDADDLGDLSWLQHCTELTHIDLDTVTINSDGVEQLIQHPTLKHFELALCSLREDAYALLREAKPDSTIITTEDKVGYVFQYDEDGRGCRVTAAIYPQHRNGKLIGVLASVQGYSGGGCQGSWNGVSIVTDESIQWVWNHWTDAPANSNNLSYGDEEMEDVPFNPVDFHGYVLLDLEFMGGETTDALQELYSCKWKHLVYDEDRDWEDLVPDTKSIVIDNGGFHYSSGLFCPALLLAGQSGGLLTSWGFRNIDLPRARQANAPALPSFTKNGVEPRYRMVIEAQIYSSPLSESSELEDDEAILKAVTEDYNKRLLPELLALGLEHLSTESSDLETVIYLMRSPKSMIEIERQLLSISGSTRISLYVVDLDGLVTQLFDAGDYCTGTVGLCDENLKWYTEAAQAQLKKHADKFET